MDTILLPQSDWHLVEPVVRGEFGNDMPVTAEQSGFLAMMDTGKVAGFIHIEQLFHLNCIYVAPEYRGSNVAFQLMSEIAQLIPKGFSAAIFTDVPRLARLAQRFGATDKGAARLLRKDF